MVWPLLKKAHILDLCKPFTIEKSHSLATHYAGVVFFDVGSVLIDLDWEGYFAAIEQQFKPSHEFSLEKFLQAAKNEHLNALWSQGKLSTEFFIQKIVALLKASCKNAGNFEISPYALKQLDAYILGNSRPKILELAKKLKEKNFVLGLLSNTTPWHVQLIYEKIQVANQFDVGIFSCDVGYEKPHVKIFEIAHEEASLFVEKKFGQKLLKNEVYFVDDTPENVSAAQEFGWQARLVNLIHDGILNKMDNNEIPENKFQEESQKRENLLFADKAASRVEMLFGNLIL